MLSARIKMNQTDERNYSIGTS